MIYPEHRADGWPLCPVCGEDELYSLFPWDGSDPKPPMQAWIDHGLKCYRCGFDSQEVPAVTSSSKEFQDARDAEHARLMAFLRKEVRCTTTTPSVWEWTPDCAIRSMTRRRWRASRRQ